MNPEMSRLKAYFHVLLNGDEASLPARRKAAQAILDDEDIGGEESKALSIPHRKAGSALAYLKGGAAKALPNAGKRAARLYAILYTVGEEAGHGPPPDELLSACRELAPHGWSVEEREGGHFMAVPIEGEPQKYAKGNRHDYASTQIHLPPDMAESILALGGRIDPADLAEDGRELKPHVTVCFGLHGGDPDGVKKVLAGEGPIRAKAGKLSLFPQKPGKEFEVLKAEVHSDDLHRINKKIRDALPHTDMHPEYNPHITVCYLRPGTGAKYLSMANPAEGQAFTADTVIFSNHGGDKTGIPLGAARYAMAGRADQYAHAPKGGISINGIWYVGGRFIPGTEGDEAVGVLPNGMQVKVGDIRRSQGEMVRSAPSRGHDTPAKIDTSPLDIMAKSLPGGRVNEAAAASLMKVVRSHEGHNAGERLIEIGAYLKAVVASLRAKGMPQAKFRLLADAAATLALAGRMLSPPDDELNGIKLAFPKAGMLYLVPGIPADSEREFLAAGFVKVAPGRFGGPDSEETRDLAERNGFTFVMPAGRDDSP